MTEKTLSKIFIYPIKSLLGISRQVTELTGKGAKWDRRWMLIDKNHRFLSQRERGQMVFLQPSLEDGHLRIEDVRGGRSALEIPLHMNDEKERKTVTIWKDQCEAISVSQDADQWFSEALDLACQLVYMPDDSVRAVDPEYAIGPETVSFSDGYPYLVAGEASMADLNERLTESLPIERFRPNLVFSGGSAYEEDEWEHFSVGMAHFRGVKPCARCQVPTIDPSNGQTGPEPIKTLAGYRKSKNKILFGLNACWDLDDPPANGIIKIGDRIQVSKA